ncbi:MAG: phosphoribosylaminoimidazolesuccinocarboxamide synthase [Candidatus Omnitrophica bacterium CG11_big_fil_rev_8_21_14_0_20_64_10]|nr:MAG: phosphoribosylaminoimidazolesuccinocarboxamide synthase [Candidatus Omnitrophica bacterium CG11_big_fil_rev_8_21_14_0_20_64_10]
MTTQSTVKKGKFLYEGKAKKFYEAQEADLGIFEYTDRATAFNAKKVGQIHDKGAVNNQVSAKLFSVLEGKGIPTHFVKLLSDREMLVRRVEIIPLEVTIRNRVAGGMARQFGIEEGRRLKQPVYELHYKSDPLDDPLMNEDHALGLGLATEPELKTIRELSFQVNAALQEFFKARQLELIDFKLEFGRHKGQVLLADEISPDTMRLWQFGTEEKMDKDRFRRDLGKVEDAYQTVLTRVLND